MNRIDLKGRGALSSPGAHRASGLPPRCFVALGADVIIWDINGDAARAAAEELGGTARQVELTDDADAPPPAPRRARSTFWSMPASPAAMRNCGRSTRHMAAGHGRSI